MPQNPTNRPPKGQRTRPPAAELPAGLNTGQPTPELAGDAAELETVAEPLANVDVEPARSPHGLPYTLLARVENGVCALEERGKGYLTVVCPRSTVVLATVVAQNVPYHAPPRAPYRWVFESGREELVFPTLSGAPTVLPPGRHVLQANRLEWQVYDDPELQKLTQQAYAIVLEEQEIDLPTEARPFLGAFEVSGDGWTPLPPGTRAITWLGSGELELGEPFADMRLRSGQSETVGPVVSVRGSAPGMVHAWR
jgi:hypothetical protein